MKNDSINNLAFKTSVLLIIKYLTSLLKYHLWIIQHSCPEEFKATRL
jgi:hypothetical protein